MTSGIHPTVARPLRLLVGSVGGYFFAAGFIAVLAAGLPNLGMARTESATLGGLVGLLIYPGVVIWAAASTRPLRVTVIVIAGAMAMIIAAPLMVPA